MKVGVDAFQVYLLGKEFNIKTDHRTLQWLITFKNSTNRLLWCLALQLFLFQVRILHCKEQDNANTDYLSRQAEWEE